jgi:hypothetical protein
MATIDIKWQPKTSLATSDLPQQPLHLHGNHSLSLQPVTNISTIVYS